MEVLLHQVDVRLEPPKKRLIAAPVKSTKAGALKGALLDRGPSPMRSHFTFSKEEGPAVPVKVDKPFKGIYEVLRWVTFSILYLSRSISL